MADFKKPAVLLLKSLFFLLLVSLSYIGLLYASIDKGQDSLSYFAATLDKMRLIRETTAPKMVFIGGSNLAFGLDSAKVSQAFDMPVVNMGLHGGVGLKYMLDQVKPYLKRGDIVIVAPEYEQFIGDLYYGDIQLLEIASYTNEWRALEDMPFITFANCLLKANKKIFLYSRDKTDLTEYTRKWFNKDGDVTAHLLLPNRKFPPRPLLTTKINQTSVQHLHNFVTSNSEQGIITATVYPCIQRNHYDNNAATVKKISTALSKGAVNVISTPQEFIYDDDYFFDTFYHLNAKGRTLRTVKMIQILSRALSK